MEEERHQSAFNLASSLEIDPGSCLTHVNLSLHNPGFTKEKRPNCLGSHLGRQGIDSP